MKVWSFDEWRQQNFPPPEFVIHPWLTTSGAALIASPPGVGKTFLGLTAALYTAAGVPFMDYTVPKPRTVLYIDGEMDPGETLERAEAILLSLPADKRDLARANFSIISHVSALDGMHLEDPKQRKVIKGLIDADLVFWDNLGTLFLVKNELTQEDWGPLQDFFLGIRACGISQVVFHHTGKPQRQKGDDGFEGVTYSQLGTSARERIFNAYALMIPDKKKTEGVFQLQWEGKWRGSGRVHKPAPTGWRIDWEREACRIRPWNAEKGSYQGERAEPSKRSGKFKVPEKEEEE